MACLTGCPTDRSPREISSKEFIAPFLDETRVLASKLNFLKAETPGSLDSELQDKLARFVPLAKLSETRLLVYETLRGALLSVDFCTACTDSVQRAPVTMHWSRSRIEDELIDTFGVIAANAAVSFDTVGDPSSPGVTPIALRGARFAGWMLAYEASSGAIIAFRLEPGFRPVSPLVPNEILEEEPNFAAGNGLLMSVVITRDELRQQLNNGRTPTISRLVELEDGKIVVMFGTSTNIREVHLLELSLEDRDFIADFSVPAGERVPVTYSVPRGTIRNADGPFVTFEFIQEQVTQTGSIKLDGMQPAYVPPAGVDFCGDGALPSGGSVLVFDSGSSSFLRLTEETNAGSERFGRARVDEFVTSEPLLEALQIAPTYFFSETTPSNDCSGLLVFEETSNNLLQLAEDGSTGGSGKLDLAADSVRFLLRREVRVVSGEDPVPSSEETILKVSSRGIRESRIFFDQGQDQLLAVHLATGNVVIVAGRADLEPFTNRPLANLTWLEVLSEPEDDVAVLRAFDSESSTLLQIKMRYTRLPEIDRER